MEFPLLKSFIPDGWVARKKPQSELFDSMHFTERAKKQQNKNQTRLQSFTVISCKLNARLKNLLALKHSPSIKPQLLFSESTDASRTEELPSLSKCGEVRSEKLRDDTNTSHQCCVDLGVFDEVAELIPSKAVKALPSGREHEEESSLRTSSNWGQNFKSAALRFAGGTSAHGYKNIISENVGKSRKLAWIVAIMSVSLILVHFICDAMIQHQSHSFTSSVRSQPSTTMAFPAVTVCNPSPWNVSVSNGLPFQFNFEMKEMLLIPGADARLRSMTVDHLQLQFATVMKTLFAKCSWGKHDVECADVFKKTTSDIAGCYSFNWNRSAQRYVHSAGSIHGLSLELNLTGFNTEGIKVVVHDPGEVPNVLGGSILVGTGNMAHIGLQRQEYKFLPRPFLAYGSEHCQDMVDTRNSNQQQQHDLYNDYSQCLALCRFHYIVERCQCRGPDFPDLGDVPYCKVDQMECFNEAREAAYTARLERERCRCPLPCNRREYSWRMSASHQKKDFVIMKIFYEDLFTRIEEHLPMSTWLSLFGTIGGNMGLLTGASVLTMIEFLEFAALVIYLSWKRACQTVISVKQTVGRLRRVFPF